MVTLQYLFIILYQWLAVHDINEFGGFCPKLREV